jgi:hypothetical protein
MALTNSSVLSFDMRFGQVVCVFKCLDEVGFGHLHEAPADLYGFEDKGGNLWEVKP